MQLADLEVGQRVVVRGELPRLVRGAEVAEHAQGAEVTATVVSLEAGVGKEVGLELDRPADGWAYYDAHNCDGQATAGRGWWAVADNVVEVL